MYMYMYMYMHMHMHMHMHIELEYDIINTSFCKNELHEVNYVYTSHYTSFNSPISAVYNLLIIFYNAIHLNGNTITFVSVW